jgi:hypothetical protein
MTTMHGQEMDNSHNSEQANIDVLASPLFVLDLDDHVDMRTFNLIPQMYLDDN